MAALFESCHPFSAILPPQRPTMELQHREEKDGYMSVPQFGGWDHKSDRTDYSMIFQRARANRKQNKIYFQRRSLGNEEELIAHAHEGSPSKSKKILSYLNCCIKA